MANNTQYDSSGGINFASQDPFNPGGFWMQNNQPSSSGGASMSWGNGGGGGGGQAHAAPSGSFWDPSGKGRHSGMPGWINSPDYGLQQQQQAFQQQKFATVWGGLQGMLARLGNGNPFQIGGDSGKPPNINAGPIWGKQQVDQQVNASKAATDASTANQNRETAGKLAGQGFGGNSPLLAALQTQNQNAGIANKTDAERNIRGQAGEMNAKQQLAGQTAQGNLWTNAGQLGIERMKPYFNLQSSLLSALAGLG